MPSASGWKPRVRQLISSVVDIRRGEFLLTFFLFVHLLLVLCAYYVLKPVSRALFLNQFDIDKLPYLYLLIAVVGGALAYFYTKLAVRASLTKAVNTATFVVIGCLGVIWYLLPLKLVWMYYVFNIWVSLFSIVLVSQGWLVASNVFDSRQAKRLYGVLGLGAVIGAAFGGSFTAMTVRAIGTTNLLLASAGMVFLSWLAFLAVARLKGGALAVAAAAEEPAEGFSFSEITASVRRYRHLQVIVAIITITYVVDVLIEYQFSALAKQRYAGPELTAFLGSFYGLYLNLITFGLQFFLTALVVSRLGVGGTLQIMPVTILASCVAMLVAPGVWAASIARLAEASTRYSFNRTGMELLYLPLPSELKNRTKAFVDIFVDRFGRGLGGLALMLLTALHWQGMRQVTIVAAAVCIVWMVFSLRAQREYVSTVRRRLSRRQLDLEEVRVSVNDPGAISMLEAAVAGDSPRQAAYALSLLGGVEHYPIENLLERAIESEHPLVRERAFRMAAATRSDRWLLKGMAHIDPAGDPAVTKAAVAYVLAVSREPAELAKRWLDEQEPSVTTGVLEALLLDPKVARAAIPKAWPEQAAAHADAAMRRLAVLAIEAAGEPESRILTRLIEDSDPAVAAEACRAAAKLGVKAAIDPLIGRLADPAVRAAAIEALAAFGPRICGTLEDALYDPSTSFPARLRIPRVLQKVHDQRSVAVLLRGIAEPDLDLRESILRALGSLRNRAPHLDFGAPSIDVQILTELHQYYELSAALQPLRDNRNSGKAASLMIRTLEFRLERSIARVFRLLGLRYPPREIYSAYLAVSQRKQEDLGAALEFLDNVLDRKVKRIFLPIFEGAEQIARSAEANLGVTPLSVDGALRRLLKSGDSWLVACAMATAAELRLHGLAGEIEAAARDAGAQIAHVARKAGAALAV